MLHHAQNVQLDIILILKVQDQIQLVLNADMENIQKKVQHHVYIVKHEHILYLDHPIVKNVLKGNHLVDMIIHVIIVVMELMHQLKEVNA